MILLGTLSNAVCISRPLCSGWWECVFSFWLHMSLRIVQPAAFWCLFLVFVWISLLACIDRSVLSQTGEDLFLFCEVSLLVFSLSEVSFSPVLSPPNFRCPGLLDLGSLYFQLSWATGIFLCSLHCSLDCKLLLGSKQGRLSGSPYLFSLFQDYSPMFSIVQCLNTVVSCICSVFSLFMEGGCILCQLILHGLKKKFCPEFNCFNWAGS